MKIGIIAAAALGGALLGPQVAEACCTNVLCDYCITSSDDCSTRCTESAACVTTWAPACNTFGCNCNNTGPTCQCGAPSNDACVPVDCCSSTTEATALAQARFKEVDLDKNGQISADETNKWLVKQFGKDWTKHVDKADVAAHKTEAKILEVIFARMDKDKNKQISPAEFDSTLGAPAKK